MPGYMKKAPAKKPAKSKAGKTSSVRKTGATKPGVIGKRK
jgi:hypothetical protein